MNQQEATDFVIQELGKLHERNDIIQRLCETTNMNWDQAKKFVIQVESQNKVQISRKQSPIVAAIGMVVAIAGLAISVFILNETLKGVIIIFLKLPIPYLGNIVYFLIGVGMVTGGLRGTWDTISQLWNS